MIEAGLRSVGEARESRPRPFLDEKLILAWNAQYAETLAQAARALGDEAYATRARALVAFLLDAFRDPESGELVRTRLGDAVGGSAQLGAQMVGQLRQRIAGAAGAHYLLPFSCCVTSAVMSYVASA